MISRRGRAVRCAPPARRGRSRAPASRTPPAPSRRGARRGFRASGWSLRATAPGRTALQSGESRAAVDPRAHDLLVQLEAVGQELVQRRVEQPDRHRPARPSPRTVPRSRLCWSGSSSSSAARRPASSSAMIIAAHLRLAIGGHEHVLGPAQPDPLGAEAVGARRRPRACRRSPARRPRRARRHQREDRLEAGVDVGPRRAARHRW